MNILVTGAAGFIGSHFVDYLLQEKNVTRIIGIDHLGYAASLKNLNKAQNFPQFSFYECNISNSKKIMGILKNEKISHVVNFAAESHVDNSIEYPDVFFDNNIMATYSLIKTCLKYQKEFCHSDKEFSFLQISTDEVYGDLALDSANSFNELSPYSPSSPYAASKASSDHIVQCFYRTYGLNAFITHCSNNFGPRQHSEKLIPKTIHNALLLKPIPIYGNGSNIRDWIFVKDHCKGIFLTLTKGKTGETYCFSGHQELTNLDIASKICTLLDNIIPKTIGSYLDQIAFVKDRLGHDQKYSLNSTKASKDLNFSSTNANFEHNLKETILTFIKEKE